MNNMKRFIGFKVLLLCTLCIFSTTAYAKPNNSIKSIESKIESLEKENNQLHKDIERLEKSQYQNIRQYHDDASSDLNTYMTWVGIIAAFLAMVVTAVSIAIPLMSNKRFEKKIDELFSSFNQQQSSLLLQNKEEQNKWKSSLEKEYQKKLGVILNKMKGIKKNVVEVQDQIRLSERKAWVSQLLSEANREINDNRFDVAIRLCTHVIEKDPENDNAYNTRGIAYGQMKMFDLAIKDFDEAINHNPQKHYYSNRALAKINKGELDNAIEDYSAAITIDSTDDKLYALRGYAYFQNKNFEMSVADYNEAIKINHDESSYYANRGIAYFMLNDFSKAIEDFSIGIKINRENPMFYFNRGNAKYQINDFSGAIADFDEAIKLNNKSFEYFANRGMAKMKVNDIEGAIKDYDESITIYDKNDNLYNERGNAKMIMRDFEGAILDFDSAISLNSTNFIYYYNRGNAKTELKKYDEAILDYNSALSINNKDADIFICRGNAQLKNSKYNEAIIDYNNAIELNDNEANYYYNRAIAKLMIENYEGVIDDCNIAIHLEDKNPLFYILKGNAECKLCDYEAAISSFKTGVSKGYSTAEAYNYIAYCYLYQEKYSEAMNYINRAIRITNNTDGNIIDTRGEIYMAQNNLNSAIDDFNKAIQLVTNNYELYEHRALCYRKLAEMETDENAKLELINNAEDDENEAERLRKNAGESVLSLSETNES